MVSVSVYVYVSVCGMPVINLVSLACLPESKSVKCEFLKKFITLRILMIDV